MDSNMNKLRKWLIRKLGGYNLDVKSFPSAEEAFGIHAPEVSNTTYRGKGRPRKTDRR